MSCQLMDQSDLMYTGQWRHTESATSGVKVPRSATSLLVHQGLLVGGAVAGQRQL